MFASCITRLSRVSRECSQISLRRLKKAGKGDWIQDLIMIREGVRLD